MKRKLLFLLTATALFISTAPAFAQEETGQATTTQSSGNYLKMDASTDTIDPDSVDQEQAQTERDWNPLYKNIAKINLTSLAFTTFSVQYERLLPHKMSVALGIKLRPSGSVPFKNSILNLASGDEEDEDLTDFITSTRIGSFVITPEFRYYLSKESGRGFYVAPFLRYEQYNLSSSFSFTDMFDNRTAVPFKGSMKNFGVGLMIGSQFKIGNRFTLDWWILGPYYSFSSKLDLKAEHLDLTPDDQKLFKESLDGVDISWIKTESEVTANSANLTMKGKFGGIRAFGLCFGVKF